MVSRNFCQAYLQEVGLTQISGDHDFFNIFEHDRFQDKFQGRIYNRFYNRFHDRQTPPSSSLKLVDFETYCIKPNPPLLFHQQNMQWSRNMVHPHFTLCLRFHDYLNGFPNTHGTAFGWESKGPHHYKVTALGSCVKWSKECTSIDTHTLEVDMYCDL